MTLERKILNEWMTLTPAEKEEAYNLLTKQLSTEVLKPSKEASNKNYSDVE